MSSTISEKYINQFVRNKPYEKIAEMKYNMVQQYHRAPLVHRIQVSLTNAAILFYEFCLIMYKINKSGKFTLKKCCNFYQSEHSLLHYLAPNLSSNSKLCIPLLIKAAFLYDQIETNEGVLEACRSAVLCLSGAGAFNQASMSVSDNV